MAKKALVLITNSFPFGKGETFVDNEIRYYSKFYPVYVVSIDNVHNECLRPLYKKGKAELRQTS